MSESEQPKNETERAPEEIKAPGPAVQSADAGEEVPLFLRGRSDGRKGDAQDEKDGMGE